MSKQKTIPLFNNKDQDLIIELDHISQVMKETNNLSYSMAIDKAICRIAELTSISIEEW